MSFKKFVSSSICTAVLCTTVSAQEAKPAGVSPQQPTTQTGASKMASTGVVTPQQIATCLALDNQEEVILAKFAQEKSKNKEVVSFAKMIAEEHQSCLKKLSKFAPEASREGYLTENSQIEPSKATSANAVSEKSATANGVNTMTTGIDMLQLQREIAQQCITDSKKYLSEKDGDEFDVCFVGMQIAKHAAMRSKLVVLQRHTTDEMRQMVTEGIQATDKHMKAAESLMAKLDGDESDNSKKSGK